MFMINLSSLITFLISSNISSVQPFRAYITRFDSVAIIDTRINTIIKNLSAA